MHTTLEEKHLLTPVGGFSTIAAGNLCGGLRQTLAVHSTAHAQGDPNRVQLTHFRSKLPLCVTISPLSSWFQVALRDAEKWTQQRDFTTIRVELVGTHEPQGEF